MAPIRCQVSGIKKQISDIRNQESEINKAVEPGPGTWHLAPGTSYLHQPRVLLASDF
jgi:hypothetical protein